MCVPVASRSCPGRRPGRLAASAPGFAAWSAAPVASPRSAASLAWPRLVVPPVPSSPACVVLPSRALAAPLRPDACFRKAMCSKTSFWHGRLAQARHSEAMAERDLGFRFGILREDASRDAEWCQTVDFAAYRIRFSFGRDPAPSGVTAAAIGFRRDVAFGSDRPAPNLARPGVTSRVARLGARRHPSALEVQHRGQNRATDALNGFAPIDGMTAEAKSNGGNRTVW